ncbi:MAG: hypothetical protein K9K38_17855, partial [Rhodoferax sp.]|nr:hypothetical protein [Rhodoferax sp.]
MGLTAFYWYMGIGFVALASLSIYGKWFKHRDAPGNIYAILEPKVTWKQRVANVFLYPLAIVFILIPIWPLLVSIELNFPWHKFKFWTDKAARSVPWTLTDEESAFKLTKADLLQKLSIADIEANERVFDPLHAVPDLPFGHLNAVWQAYVEGLEPDCELWSFSGRWKTQYRDWQMQGYVALHGEKIGSYFLTSQKSMQAT